MFFAALTPLLPHYAHELGLSKAGAGTLQAAYPAGAFVGAIPSGLVASRLGVKATALIGLCCVAVTSAVFGFASSTWLLDGARFVQGLGSSFSWTGALAWLVAAAPADRRGHLIGSAMGLAIAGALFGPVLGGVASKVGTGPAFTTVAVLALAQAAWAATRDAPRPEPPQPLARLVDAMRTGRVAAGMWFTMLPALLFGTLGVLAPLRLSYLGWGSLAIGAVWLVSAGLEGLIAPYVGRVSDRRGQLPPIAVGLACSVVLLAVLPWPHQAPILAAIVGVAGIAFGSFWTPAMALLADAAEERGLEHAWGFAIVGIAWAPGQAFGAAAGGAVAKVTTDSAVYLALAGVSAVTLAVLLRHLRAAP